MSDFDDTQLLNVAPLGLRRDVFALPVKEPEGIVVLATNETQAC